VKGFLIADGNEAQRIMRQLEFPILLQEFIPGPSSAGYFLDGFADRQGVICAVFARQRLRTHPAPLGNTTLTVSIPVDTVRPALESLRRLLLAIKYRGIFSAEFKYDDRSGQFKLIEINARPWWHVEFAASCGVDVCSMAYRDALGLTLPPVREYEVGRRCVFFTYDLWAWKDQRPGASLWSWVRPWLGADSALFHWWDPGPAIAHARSLLRDRAAHRARERAQELSSDARFARKF
jgi:hypothetical protein